VSWFRSALSISVPEPGSYYSVIDPINFYEWRFTGIVPKGTTFTKQLPPSDIFTQGQVIVSASIPDDFIKTVDNNPRLSKDTQTDVILKVGCMPSFTELIDKYKDLSSNFKRSLSSFKDDIVVRKFIYSDVMKPSLFGVSKFTKDEVTFDNYGPLDEVKKRFAKTREFLLLDSEKKVGRAYEMEKFLNYEKNMQFVNNSNLHVDELKISHLINNSGLKSKSTETISWQDFYLKSSQKARNIHKSMSLFENAKWFQASYSWN